jgi:hypothetical protein
MLLTVKDGNGATHTIIVVAQDSLTDHSGAIDATNAAQPVMGDNANRSGFYFQNNSTHNMTLNEMDGDPTIAGAWVIPPNGVFPPPGYPVSTNAINVAGTAGDTYTAREW